MFSCFSHVWLCTILWTVAHRVPLSMRFSRSGFPCPPAGDLPDPGIEPASLRSPALTGRFFTTSATQEAPLRLTCAHNYRKYTSEEEIHHWWPGFHHCFLEFFSLQVWSPWGAEMEWTSLPEAMMSEIRGEHFSWIFLSFWYSVLICFKKKKNQCILYLKCCLLNARDFFMHLFPVGLRETEMSLVFSLPALVKWAFSWT